MKHLKYIFIFVLALLTGVAARGQSGSGFNPTSPTDPGTPTHKVFYRSTPCSGMNNSIDVKEGAAFKVTASNITNYRFDYWTVEGTDDKVTTPTYNGTMGTRNINLVAHYTFSPATPTDPSADKRERYTLYGLSQAAVRGTTTSYSLYLDNTNVVTDLQFDVLLPAGVSLDPAAITLAVRANGYTLTATPIQGGYTLHIAGGSTIEDTSGRLLDLPLSLSPSAADALSITLANASAHLVGGTVAALATHTGTIAVSDPAVEEEVQAQFSFDRYFNRVAFTNSSSENAETFEWNFGDGTTSTERNPFHVYTAAGTYHVTLRARNINNEGIAERDIVISEPSTWTLSGDYTLDPTTEALRNFTSIDEMFSILSQGHVGADVNVAFVSGGLYEEKWERPDYCYAITDASLAGLTQLAQHFSTAGHSLTFGVPAGAAYSGNVNFTTTAPTSEVYHALADFIANMTTWRDGSATCVSLSIDGVALNFSGRPAQTEESICAGSEHTTAIDFTSLGSGVRTSVQIFFTTSSNHLSGYAPSSDDAKSLPAMTISHSGTDVESFRYAVRHFIHDIEFAAYDHVIRVTPPLANQSLNLHTPSEGATQRPGSQTLSWNNIKGTTRYEVSVTDDALDGSAPVTNVYETTSSSKSITITAGHRYTWQVTAYGKCDELTSAEQHFSVSHLANLTTTNVRVTDLAGHPLTSVGGLQEVRVVATITNTGLAATSQSLWEDALYASANTSTGSAQVGTPVRLDQQRHQGVLKPGESYEVSFTTTTPDPEQLTVIYSVRADDKGYERETDTTDNEASSAVISISSRQIAASDYAALRAFAEAMSISIWNTESDIVSESNYPGVSFDADGYVSSIDLSGQGLVGVLPAVVFPHLASINFAHNQLEAPIDVFINQQTSLTSADLSYNHIFTIGNALPTRIKTFKVGGQFADLSAGELHALAGTKGIPAVQEMAMKQYCNTFNPGTLVTYNHKAPLEPNHPTFVLLADNGKRTVGSLVYKANFGMYVLQISGDYKEASGAPLVARVQGDAASGTCLPISLTWLLGDANADNYVNVLDAQQTLNRILARQTGNFNFLAANTYGYGSAEGPDDIINIQDMIATVNIFLEDAAPSAHRAPAYVEYDDNDALRYDDDDDALRYDDDGYYDNPVGTLRLQNGYLWLDTVNDDVAALDILIAGVQPSQISLQLPSSRYQLLTRATGEGTRLVILSPTGDSFGTGSVRLLRIGGSRASIIDATASSLDAQPLALDYYIATPTAIEAVEAPDASAPVYDLSGRRVTKAQAKSIILTEGRKAIR